ncbi:hypothetical protein [Agathobaculum sp.]|uniref:hypothetical protein n=1 Tax=Agathobaculum sp. TaxID=2048138 RepID=UPI002A80D08C|nr:hypothetical protein [Agathobaculum sp.]MDY3618385.1 hypothetical protein [Agathobaculum sp.]
MKIESFIKRLNATELGEGVTNDTYIAIPRDVDLSQMLENQQAMTIFDRVEGVLYTPENSNIKYVQTGQNNQERISGLGQYFRRVNANVGDEILIEKVENGDSSVLYLDFNHRDVIVFQKNKDWVEILTPQRLEPYKTNNNYLVDVIYQNERVKLNIKYLGPKMKKKTSPADTAAYDLLIDDKSILPNYEYLDYIEISNGDADKRLARMKTYMLSQIDTINAEGDKI